jgi:hypothetical protein
MEIKFFWKKILKAGNQGNLALLNFISGGERDRTDDLLLAKQALSQLSYTPIPNSDC